jgi:hypothetical protein
MPRRPRSRLLRSAATQAEDRALVGTNPSADLGAKTEARVATATRTLQCLGLGTKRQIPGGLGDSVPQRSSTDSPLAKGWAVPPPQALPADPSLARLGLGTIRMPAAHVRDAAACGRVVARINARAHGDPAPGRADLCPIRPAGTRVKATRSVVPILSADTGYRKQAPTRSCATRMEASP